MAFAQRRPVQTLLLVVVLVGGGVFGWSKLKFDRRSAEAHRIVAIKPQAKSVTITQPYVGKIHAQRHIKIRAAGRARMETVHVREGQAVKEGDLLFTLKKPETKTKQPPADLNLATIKAPFDGIVDRLHHPPGSVVAEGEVLTTLADNSVMWVYFNVPEARYLDYMADLNQLQDKLQIELVLANGDKFPNVGKLGAIEADFNSENGTVPFRADFPNPDRLLRHGQTGNVLIHKVVDGAIVVPQRATFELSHKRYVYVVDKEHVVRQREIAIQNELDDIFVIKQGIGVNDTIVLDGIRELRDGDKVEFADRHPETITANLK
jgi:membrane fusion protein (multidrug efflux system)